MTYTIWVNCAECKKEIPWTPRNSTDPAEGLNFCPSCGTRWVREMPNSALLISGFSGSVSEVSAFLKGIGCAVTIMEEPSAHATTMRETAKNLGVDSSDTSNTPMLVLMYPHRMIFITSATEVDSIKMYLPPVPQPDEAYATVHPPG